MTQFFPWKVLVVVVVAPKAPPFWKLAADPLECPEVLIVDAVVPAVEDVLPEVPAVPWEVLPAATFVDPLPPGPEVVVEVEFTVDVAPAVATVLVETEATPPFPLVTTVVVPAKAGAAIAAMAVATRKTRRIIVSCFLRKIREGPGPSPKCQIDSSDQYGP